MMTEVIRSDVAGLIQDIKRLTTENSGQTPEERQQFGSRCKAVVWDLTRILCGHEPTRKTAIGELVQTCSVHRGDIHRLLSENEISYFISVKEGMLIGEIVDRPSGQMIHCAIADGYDHAKLNELFRNSQVQILDTFH